MPGVHGTMNEEDKEGFKIFCKFCENVLLFTGSHRFLDKDLSRLFDIMRTKGGAVVPEDLRAKIRERIVSRSSDPRLKPDYAIKSSLFFGSINPLSGNGSVRAMEVCLCSSVFSSCCVRKKKT